MKNIAAKLVKVMEACDYIQKDAQNKEQKYKYASAAAILGKVNPALVENKLVSIPEYSVVSEKEKTTGKGGVWQLVTVQCKLLIIDSESGETLTVTALGTGTDPGDKAVAKAQTMALKYAWMTTLNIETGDDPEEDPRTDNAEFQWQPGQQNRLQELSQLWYQKGWDTNILPDYLFQRFGKTVNQITEPELEALINETRQYLQGGTQ